MNRGAADYYDRNTRRFLRWGHGGRDLAIHRAVWGPDIRDRSQAIHYVHELINQLARTEEPVELWDLGCGVGGSMIYLASRLDCQFVGLTISGVQAEMANQNLTQRGLDRRCRVVKGSYLDKTLLSGGKHPRILYAIESFIHGPDPDQFFLATAGATQEGDSLVICDDFLADESQTQNRWVKEYREGWRVTTLLSLEQLTRSAEAAGWTVDDVRDLTAAVEIGRLRDYLIRWITALLRPLRPQGAFWDNLFGGNALQVCLRRDLVRYLFVTLRRTAPPS